MSFVYNLTRRSHWTGVTEVDWSWIAPCAIARGCRLQGSMKGSETAGLPTICSARNPGLMACSAIRNLKKGCDGVCCTIPVRDASRHTKKCGSSHAEAGKSIQCFKIGRKKKKKKRGIWTNVHLLGHLSPWSSNVSNWSRVSFSLIICFNPLYTVSFPLLLWLCTHKLCFHSGEFTSVPVQYPNAKMIPLRAKRWVQY